MNSNSKTVPCTVNGCSSSYRPANPWCASTGPETRKMPRARTQKKVSNLFFMGDTFPIGGECLIVICDLSYERRLAGLFVAADSQQQADMCSSLGAL